MKLPKEVVIGENVWKVKRPRDLGVHYNKIIDGETDPGEKLILVRHGMGFKDTIATFIHETIHAIEEEYGFELPHHLLHKLDEALAQVLMDNFLSNKVSKNNGV